MQNDRVIGGINSESTEKTIQFYRHFVRGTLHRTNARTAEMCKLTENSSRDVQIAFANELSLICDKAGINVWELIELANKHPRVNILRRDHLVWRTIASPSTHGLSWRKTRSRRV